MTNALVLTASSLGRSAVPGEVGGTLLVDADNAVTLDVWPQPSWWVPEGVKLLRDGREVPAAGPGDDLRWTLTGADRFGTFRASGFAGDRVVESGAMVVRPAVADLTVGVAAGRLTAQATAAGAASQPAAAPASNAGPASDAAPPSPGARVSRSDAAARPSSPPASDAPTLRAPDPAPSAPPNPTPPRPSATLAPTTPPPPEPSVASPRPRTPAHARPEDLADSIELQVGEYDGRFAAWTAAIFSAFSLTVMALVVVRMFGDPDWFATTTTAAPDSSTAPGPPTDIGSIAERIGLATATLLLAVGLILLLAGAALAALEVRARQRRAAANLVSRGSPATLGLLPRILYRASQVPATIAVLVTGGVMVALGFLAQVYWASLF